MHPMQGNEYFSHYADGKWRTKYFDDESRQACDIGLILADKLWRLYGDGQIFELASGEAPGVLSSANLSVEALKAVRSLSSSVPSSYRGLEVDPAYAESSHEDKIDVASKTIREERSALGAKLAITHDQMLSRCIMNIAKSHPERVEDPEYVGKIVRDNILFQNRELANRLAPWQGLIHASYDSTSGGIITNTEVSVKRRPNFPVPDWLEGSDLSTDPVNLLCSLIGEAETLIVLNHWVAENNLPYLPVLAPMHFEAGSYDASRKNPHADILLCNLMPDSNEVIPVQVKRKSNSMYAENYIEGMRFVTPQDLGLWEIEPRVIKHNGIVNTGQRVTYVYGKILNDFVETTLASKGKKPKKAQLQGYKQTLEDAIPGLEYALGVAT